MAERRWLWDAADELLVAWSPAGTERAYAGPAGRERPEFGGTSDREQFHRAYDQLLWEIVTSPADALVVFAARFFEQPYLDLPPPLQVTVWRLIGLEGGGGVEPLRAAVAGISCYCSPDEEAGATCGIVARIKSLGG